MRVAVLLIRPQLNIDFSGGICKKFGETKRSWDKNDKKLFGNFSSVLFFKKKGQSDYI